MVHEIEDKDQFDKALKNAGSKLVIVDFTATWCGPCKSISPFSYALAENYEDVVFLKVDVDEVQDVAEVCQIKCMPTFQYYKNGKKIDEFAGSNRETLEQKLMANK